MPKQTDTPATAAETILGRTTDLMPVRLTIDELADRGRKLADLVAKAVEIKDHAKSAAQDAKAEVDRIALEVNAVTRVVREGYELRDVELEDRANHATGRYTRIRMDTGEVVVERLLTPHERQTGMDLN